MKKLNVSQMENLQGEARCSENKFMYIAGVGVFLTLATGPVGAYALAAGLGGCYFANVL